MSVSDDDLKEKIKEILADPASNGITPKDVRLILEKQFKIDLVDRKKDIKQLIEKVISEPDEEVQEITDKQIEKEINRILDNYTGDEILPSKVREMLEDHFKVKLDNRKKLIKRLIIQYNEKVVDGDDKGSKRSTKKEKVKKEKPKKEEVKVEEEEDDDDEEEEEEEKPKKKKLTSTKKTTKKTKPKNVDKELDTSEEEEDNDDENLNESDREMPSKRKRESTKSTSSKKTKKLTNLVYLSNQLTDIIGIRSIVPEDLYERLDNYLERNNLRVNKNEILLNDELIKMGNECGILGGDDKKKISQYKWKQIVKNNMFNSKNVDADGVPLPSVINERKRKAEEYKEKLERGECGLYLKPQLSEFMNKARSSRGDIMKKLWGYIHEHDLQNPSNRKEILCDEVLEKIFKKKKIDMFKMAGAISKLASKDEF